jgi:AcrR family transcriptional regulator
MIMTKLPRTANRLAASDQTPADAGPPLRTGQTEKKRQQVLLGARRVFLRDGFDATRMELVAKEAGVSKGTLYNYFSSKEALLSAVVQDRCRSMREGIFSLDQAQGPPEAVLQMVGTQFLSTLLHPEQMSMFRHLVALAPRMPQLGQDFFHAGPELGAIALGRYLRRLADSGFLVLDDEVRAAYQFIALCETPLMLRARMQVDQPTDSEVEQAVASAVRVFLAGFATSVG